MVDKILASLIIALSAFSGVKTADNNPDYFFKPFFSPEKSAVVLPVFTLNQSFSPALKEVFPQFLPERENMPAPEIKISAGIIISSNGNIIYEKNVSEKLPIASVTKLLTALVVLDNLDQDDAVEISKNAVKTYGENGDLVVGEKLSVLNLLHIMLISSSNDAAIALGEEILKSNKAIGILLNEKAKAIGMENFSFYDFAGLDAKNSASAADLAVLTRAAIENEIIRKIIGIEKIDIMDKEGKFVHHLENTNKLFGKINNLIGGKTGYTNEAGECLVLAVNSSVGKGYFIAAILGAKTGERFNDMEKLINWAKLVYGL